MVSHRGLLGDSEKLFYFSLLLIFRWYNTKYETFFK